VPYKDSIFQFHRDLNLHYSEEYVRDVHMKQNEEYRLILIRKLALISKDSGSSYDQLEILRVGFI